MRPEQRTSNDGSLAAFLFVGLALFYLVGTLVGPRVPDSKQSDYCVSNYDFVWIFGHSLNCDSSEFLVNAKDPSMLLAPDSMRQERPGASALVYVISWPLDAVYRALAGSRLQIERNADPSGRIAPDRVERIQDKAQFVPQYVGFIALHALTLAACLGLYAYSIGLGALRWEHLSLPSFWLGLLFVVNNVTKQFFWSPHTQLLNILAAVGGVAACVALAESARRHRLYWAVSFAFGVMMLFYGAFLVPVVVTGLIYLYLESRDNRLSLRFLRRLLTKNLVAVALFVAPYAAWYASVIFLNGAFNHFSLDEHGHLVWVTETYASEGIWPVVKQYADYWYRFSRNAFIQGWGFLILLAALGAFVMRTEPARGSVPGARSDIAILSSLLSILVVSLLNALYASPALRLAYSAIFPLFIILGVFMRRVETNPDYARALMNATVCGLTLYTIWMVVKFGPYS